MTVNTPITADSPVDISSCDQEPIHVPGFIQPHGMLLVLSDPDLQIVQVSDNTALHLGRSARELSGLPLSGVLDAEYFSPLLSALEGGRIVAQPLHVCSATLGGELFHVLAHRYDGLIIVELERAVFEGEFLFQNAYSLVSGAVSRLESAADADELCSLAAREVRALSGLDKVMIYLFDEAWNGLVVAEDKAPDMDSYLGLRFPASDIPRQARELYLRNKLRLISDVHSTPVPIIPTRNAVTGRSLDLSYAALRSVSPVHIEYLKNMGVGASMSVSIVRDGKLAGLIACHHRGPKFLSYEARTACEFLGQVLAVQLGAREKATERDRSLQSAQRNVQLLEHMALADDFAVALSALDSELLELVGAGGAAIYSEEKCVLLGQTPSRREVETIAEWLESQNRDIIAIDALAQELPGAEAFQNNTCGVLSISISRVHRNFIIWFRPEIVQAVNWAGNPHKPVEVGTGRLHPRQSFEIWKETVRLRSQPWQAAEIEAASALRAAIVGIVLRQAEERAQLSTQLLRSNQELEAFSYSVSHDLRAPFRHIIGFAKMLEKRAESSLDETSLRYLGTISESAHYAGTLVDNLLAFSRMGRSEMRLGTIDMAQLFEETRVGLKAECAGRIVEWRIGALPKVRGDLAMLRLATQNLLSNAVKYTRGREVAIIEVECHEEGREWIFTVRDNGVGFDMSYVDKLFGVFQRLHRAEEFEGTGIGLANTRRIVTRHGGRTWAQGTVGEGATFGFSLPKTPLQKQTGETS
jgi:light-regulated signal transduction histidine kinase (bacteriophytochrome)